MGIEEQFDKLIDLGEDIKSRLDRLVGLASDHFVGAGKMVVEEPAKDPADHLAGPQPDAGEGYRLLSKDPPEELQEGDEYELGPGRWCTSANASIYKRQDKDIWYRRKIEQPAEPAPAWEPKVGDWVKVTKPVDWIEWEHPRWEGSMHQFDNRIGQIECEWEGHFQIRGFAASNEFRYQFHRDWLSPAEPEYREPVLPGDAGKYCEFSDDGETWRKGCLRGFDYDEHRHQGGGWRRNQNCSIDRARHRYARIKKDA